MSVGSTNVLGFTMHMFEDGNKVATSGGEVSEPFETSPGDIF